MHFNVNDIITRRERDRRQAVFISQDWLVTNVKGLGEYALRVSYRHKFLQSVKGKKRKQQKVLPDTGASWRYLKNKNGFYYDYDRIPEARRAQLPSKTELLNLYKKSLESNAQSELERELLIFVNNLTPYLKHYSGCTDVQAGNLARAAAVIQFAANEVAASEPTSSNEYYRLLSAIVVKYGWAYLPKNYRRLKEKITHVVNGAKITTVIQLPRAGNNNREPYQNEQVKKWVMELRKRPENYSNAHIARRILKMCKIANIKAPSFSWIEHFLAEWKVKFLTGKSRFGSGRKGADYNDYIPMAGALYAGDCWQCDGTRINFIPHKSADGKERSLMIIAIRDVHSGDIIGFHLDTKEDRYGYIHAMNMAVRNTGHLPFELVHDRFPGHNTDEWLLISKRMEREGTKITITSTGTGKSFVERCFLTIQDVFMQDFEYYYGHGIQSTVDRARRSSEYLAKAKKRANKAGWGFDEAWRATCSLIENYRKTPLEEYSTKHKNIKESPRELYQMSETPNTYKVDEWTRVELFGTMRKQTMRNNGHIVMRIHGAKYNYHVTDYDIISNYKQIKVYYDLEDLGKIYVFDPSDDINSKFLCEVCEEELVPYYGTVKEEGMKKLAKAKQARKKIREKRDAELEEMTYGAADELALLMPVASGKTDVDSAETRYLEDYANIWQPKKGERRIDKESIPEPVEVEEDDLELVVIRNY